LRFLSSFLILENMADSGQKNPLISSDAYYPGKHGGNFESHRGWGDFHSRNNARKSRAAIFIGTIDGSAKGNKGGDAGLSFGVISQQNLFWLRAEHGPSTVFLGVFALPWPPARTLYADEKKTLQTRRGHEGGDRPAYLQGARETSKLIRKTGRGLNGLIPRGRLISAARRGVLNSQFARGTVLLAVFPDRGSKKKLRETEGPGHVSSGGTRAKKTLNLGAMEGHNRKRSFRGRAFAGFPEKNASAPAVTPRIRGWGKNANLRAVRFPLQWRDTLYKFRWKFIALPPPARTVGGPLFELHKTHQIAPRATAPGPQKTPAKKWNFILDPLCPLAFGRRRPRAARGRFFFSPAARSRGKHRARGGGGTGNRFCSRERERVPFFFSPRSTSF